ncbi:MAG: hypothetical protein AAGE96_07460 [Cyanobacteria bacterium P01_G01_bin.19]
MTNFTKNHTLKPIFLDCLSALNNSSQTKNINKIIERIKTYEIKLLAAVEFNLKQKKYSQEECEQRKQSAAQDSIL